jgi:CHAD domain-containing protein
MDPLATFTHPELDVAALGISLGDAGFVPSPPESFRRTVLDTFDGRLHAAGLRLERVGGAEPELVLTGGGAAPARVPADDTLPRTADDLPAGPFRARIAPVLDIRVLLPLVTVEGRRTLVTKRDDEGKLRVTVALHDQLEVEGHPEIRLPGVAEVHELTGYARDARKVAKLLPTLGLAPAGGDVASLAAGAAGTDLAGVSGSPTVDLEPDEPAVEAYRRVLTNLLDVAEANRPGTIDDLDPEFLHDLRVAVRRSRSVLSQAKGVLPPDVRDTQTEELRWLGGITGPARDLDVYVLEWDGYVAPLGDDAAALDPVLAHLEQKRVAAYRDLAKQLRSRRTTTLLRRWRRDLDALVVPAEGTVNEAAPDAGRPVGEVAAERITKAHRRLVTHGRAIDADSPAEALHDLRKDAKKLRYLLECFGGLYEPDARKAFVKRLKALQDNLGEHQDAEVHIEEVRTMADELVATEAVDAGTLLAMGRLVAHLEGVRVATRGGFAERFADFDTKATRRALDALLDSVGQR